MGTLLEGQLQYFGAKRLSSSNQLRTMWTSMVVAGASRRSMTNR